MSIAATGSTTTRRLQVLLASVLIPLILLMVFSLRSLQAQQRARQTELRDQATRAVQEVQRSLEAQLGTLHRRMEQAVQDYPGSWKRAPKEGLSWLETRFPNAKGIWLMGTDGSILVPAIGRAAGLAPMASGLTLDPRTLSFQAVQAEVAGRPGEAAKLWLKQEIHRELLPAERLALARSLLKGGKSQKAQEELEALATLQPATHEEGMPIPLAARFLLLQAHSSIGPPASLQEERRQLLAALLEAPWRPGQSGLLTLGLQLLQEMGTAPWPPGLASAQVLEQDLQDRHRDQQARQERWQGISDRVLQGGDGNLMWAQPDLLLLKLQTSRLPGRILVTQLDPVDWLRGVTERLKELHRLNPALKGGVVPIAAASASSGVRLPLEPGLPAHQAIVELDLAAPSMRGPMILQALMMVLAFCAGLLGLMMSLRGVSMEMALARRMSDFVSNVSHELRTPLTTIRLKSEMLHMGVVQDPVRQKAHHRTILSEAERLSRLIDNVLDFSRMEAKRKKFSFRRGNLRDLIAEVHDVIGEWAKAEGYTIVCNSDPSLPDSLFDNDALLQACINLVGNAIKYSPDADEVLVQAQHRGGKCVISVRDYGMGIPPEDLSNIFDRFYRGADPRARKQPGTGLGLAIVRHIVDAHGGKLEVDSVVGEGSEFRMILPLRQTPPRGAKA